MIIMKIIYRFLIKIEQLIRYSLLSKVSISSSADIDNKTTFQGFNKVASNTRIRESDIGRGTYIGEWSIIKKTSIGQFCSIGPNFRIIDGNHPSKKFVSTYPAFYRKKGICGLNFSNIDRYDEYTYIDCSKKYFCKIGNDVWIGDSVSILNGVNIGNGAILASGAVIVNDVPPYAIVGGIPARIIRYRFSNDQINNLESIKWWNWSLNKIKQFQEEFDNITNFLESVENNDDL